MAAARKQRGHRAARTAQSIELTDLSEENSDGIFAERLPRLEIIGQITTVAILNDQGGIDRVLTSREITNLHDQVDVVWRFLQRRRAR